MASTETDEGLLHRLPAPRNDGRDLPSARQAGPRDALRGGAGLPAPLADMMNLYSVYVLRCSDGSLYIGSTSDMERRLTQHRAGKVEWTRSRLPVSAVYRELFTSQRRAIRRERHLKSGFGRGWLRNFLRREGKMAAGAAGAAME